MDKKLIKVLAHTVEPVHNFYKTQFSIKIPKVKYCYTFDSNKTRDSLVDSNNASALFSLKSIRRKIFNKLDPFDFLQLPKMKPISTDCDLIHMAGIIPITNSPWVVDFEDFSMFVGYQTKHLYSPQVKFLIQKCFSSKRCKRILPWTFAAKKGMEYYFAKAGLNKNILDKVEVVYPFTEPKKLKKKKSSVSKLFFIGKEFYLKGGIDVIESFLILRKRMDCELTLISKIPKSVIDKYSDIKGLNLIQSGPLVSNSFIEDCYQSSDLFILPTHMDTLGFVILEAMSYGLPIVSVNQFSVSELVTNNGILVDNIFSIQENNLMRESFEYSLDYSKAYSPNKQYLIKLADACEKILTNTSLRNKMGKNSLFEVEKGKFSKKKRVAALSKIYFDSLIN